MSTAAQPYESASLADRYSSWNWRAGEPTPSSQTRAVVRGRARQAYANQSYLRSVVEKGVGDIVGAQGIQPDVDDSAWREWSESTACDADGVSNFAGLQARVLRAVYVSGEVVTRVRYRRQSDGLPLNLQIEVLEPDVLDVVVDRDGERGRRIRDGIEFDRRNKRTAYYLRRSERSLASARIRADDVHHCYRMERPGQRRGLPLVMPAMQRLAELDAFCDAQLVKQRLAASFAVGFTTPDGSDADAKLAELERSGLQPGSIMHFGPGGEVTAIQPPPVEHVDTYIRCLMMEIAGGCLADYAAVSQDWKSTNFSTSRAARLSYQRSLDVIRADVLDQFCRTVYRWILSATMPGQLPRTVEWYAPRLPSHDQYKETRSDVEQMRAGVLTFAMACRDRGLNPSAVLEQLDAEKKERERRGLTLSIDAGTLTREGYAVDLDPSATEPPQQPQQQGAA